MNGVRLVARIFGVVGWITLVVAIIALLIMLTQISRILGPGGGITAAISSFLPIAILAALGPFTVWAGLTGVCELHEQGERLLHAMQSVDRTFSKMAAPGIAPESGAGDGSRTEQVGVISAGDLTVPQAMRAMKAVSIYRGHDHPKGSPIAWVPVNGKVVVLSRHGGWVRVKGPLGIEGLVEADALGPLEG